MEYPDLGEHCSEETCKRLDFLPVKCDACQQTFCSNHMKYGDHNCPSAYQKNVQVPVCPLCNKPVPIARGASPDVAVGKHIDNDCQSERAPKNKVFSNKCSLKGCKIKEIVPVQCADCRLNFCFKHRHTADHNCEGLRKRTAEAAVARQKQNNATRGRNPASLIAMMQGSMSEDEALARALQMSMENNVQPRRNTSSSQNCMVC